MTWNWADGLSAHFYICGLAPCMSPHPVSLPACLSVLPSIWFQTIPEIFVQRMKCLEIVHMVLDMVRIKYLKYKSLTHNS